MNNGGRETDLADQPLLAVKNLDRSYEIGGHRIEVLKGLELSVSKQNTIAVVGASGVGKSTLLHILGTLDHPTRGEVLFEGRNIFQLSPAELAKFRNRKIGFVFQDHCLLPQCSVLENVLVPTLVAPPGDHEARARKLLDRVGLNHRLNHLPGELSGGEKQRVAIARALIRDPLLLLCDEPTGNLDRDSAGMAASLLLELHRERAGILVVVTHSQELATKMSQVYRLSDGRLHRIDIPDAPQT